MIWRKLGFFLLDDPARLVFDFGEATEIQPHYAVVATGEEPDQVEAAVEYWSPRESIKKSVTTPVHFR